MSGGDWASGEAGRDELRIEGEVRWFAASDKARRGFCPNCGAFLFWEAHGSGQIAFALGAVDGATGLSGLRHIFVPEGAPEGGPLRDACLCGAVTVEHPAEAGEVTACHCIQCRKVSGHLPRFLDDPGRVSRVTGEVARFTSPGGAVRSFCPVCGTKLAFDEPTGLRYLHAGLFDALAARRADVDIFAAWKGDYYDIPEGVPAYPEAGPD